MNAWGLDIIFSSLMHYLLLKDLGSGTCSLLLGGPDKVSELVSIQNPNVPSSSAIIAKEPTKMNNDHSSSKPLRSQPTSSQPAIVKIIDSSTAQRRLPRNSLNSNQKAVEVEDHVPNDDDGNSSDSDTYTSFKYLPNQPTNVFRPPTDFVVTEERRCLKVNPKGKKLIRNLELL